MRLVSVSPPPAQPKCETPKSPPGDYNSALAPCIDALASRVKHLNPRQGITIQRDLHLVPDEHRGVKHLNPRQGITIRPAPPAVHPSRRTLECETPKSPPGDYNSYSPPLTRLRLPRQSVKHLNPRQGITMRMASTSG